MSKFQKYEISPTREGKKNETACAIGKKEKQPTSVLQQSQKVAKRGLKKYSLQLCH